MKISYSEDMQMQMHINYFHNLLMEKRKESLYLIDETTDEKVAAMRQGRADAFDDIAEMFREHFEDSDEEETESCSK